MFATRFKSVCIESYGLHLPEYKTSSLEIEEQLADLYKKLNVPFGTLEKLSGVSNRGFFGPEGTPSAIATAAAERALEGIGFDRAEIKTLFNCSVTRDFFEPATALLVHRNLGFSEQTMAMDITNACIGFSNGMVMLANLIESGVIKAGLLTSGENLGPITSATLREMNSRDDIGRDELLKLMPTFTLGSGAVAMVMCHESIATRGHRYLGACARSASQFNELCIGNGDFCYLQKIGLNPVMTTDSPKLMANAAKLGARVWADTSELLGWTADSVDHIFCHQVGKQVNRGFYETQGLAIEKEYTVYQDYGNLVSAALPSAVITAAMENKMKKGDKLLLTAYGSGLNSIFSGIEW